MAQSTTRNSLFFVDWQTFERKALQYVPMEVTEQRISHINGLKVIGRNHSVPQFLGGDTNVSFDVNFYGDTAYESARWLKRFTFNRSNRTNPPLLKIIWAGYFPDDALWTVRTLDFSDKLFMPAKGFKPHDIKVTLNLVRYTPRNLFFEDLETFFP